MESTENGANSEYVLSEEEQVVLTKLNCIKEKLKFKVHIMKSLLAVNLKVMTADPQTAEQIVEKLEHIANSLEDIVQEIVTNKAANPGVEPALPTQSS